MTTGPTRLSALVLAAVFTALALAAQETPRTEPAPLDGLWLGEAEHNGQTSRILLEFGRHPEAGPIARLSFPDLHVWDITAIPVTVEGSRIALASWTLERQSGNRLVGHLPEVFVPVHRIPVTFSPVESFERRAAAPIAAPPAEPVWTRDLEAPVWAGLEAHDGLVFVGDDSGRLSALEAESGRTLWSVETAGAIRATPSLIDGTLYVNSDDGRLYALDPASGDERWTSSLGDVERIPLGAEGSRYNHYGSGVAAAGGSLYVGTFAGEIIALDEVTGAERWRFATDDTIAGTPAVVDGRVYFGSFDGRVYAVDASTGAELWRHDTGAPVVSSPAVHRGLVVIGSRSYDLLALSADTGEPVWKYYYWFSWVESSVTIRDGVGYVGSSDGQELLAVDPDTGDPRWTFDTHGSAWSRPAVTDRTVFIGTVGVADYWAAHEGALLAVDRASGEPRWAFPLDRPGEASTWGFAASAALEGGLVFTADLSGRVYAFRQDG